jgi:hypothetical protein
MPTYINTVYWNGGIYIDIDIDIDIEIYMSLYQYIYLYLYISLCIYIFTAVSKIYRIPNTPHHLRMLEKVSASGARFCRQYERNCRTHPLCLQLGRERGLPGLLCTFIFSGLVGVSWRTPWFYGPRELFLPYLYCHGFYCCHKTR